MCDVIMGSNLIYMGIILIYHILIILIVFTFDDLLFWKLVNCIVGYLVV